MAPKDFDREYERPILDPQTGKATGETEKVYRNARLETDRTFVIAGREFTRRAGVAPEAIPRWLSLVGGDYDPLPSEVETIEIFDETIIAFLEPGQEAKWLEARSPDVENPITLQDLRAVVRWIVEADAGRPTRVSAPSIGGSVPPPTGTPSTDASASPAAEDSTG